MRCLVTGGTGFIGSHIVRKLLHEECDVFVMQRVNSSGWRINECFPGVKVLHGDLSNIPEIGNQIRSCRPDVVIHTGWAGVTKDQRADYHQQIVTNLLGSMELLKICVDSGCSLWIGLGSQAEYGSTDEILVENMHANPNTLYGAAKLSVGQLSYILCNASSVRQVWLRLTAAYGPMDDPHHLIPYTITTLLKEEVPNLTPGTQCWDFLYIEDAINAIWLAILNHEVSGIYNLSAGYATEIRKICELIRDQINPKLPLGFGNIPYQPDERKVLLANNARFSKAANWSPKISLEQGLERTIAWYATQAVNR